MGLTAVAGLLVAVVALRSLVRPWRGQAIRTEPEAWILERLEAWNLERLEAWILERLDEKIIECIEGSIIERIDEESDRIVHPPGRTR